MEAASSGALDSAPAVTTEISVCRGLDAQLGAGASLLSWALWASACPGGRPDPGLCPGALCSRACAVGFALRPGSLLSMEPRPSPLSCSWVQPCTLQPFREFGALSPGCRCLLVSQGAWGHPRPPGILPEVPASAFPSGKIGEAPASLGRGFPVLGTLAAALARLLVGTLPLRCLLFLYFFFPLSS